MKTYKHLILLIGTLISLSVNGQSNESGSVIYEEISRMDIKFTGSLAYMNKDIPSNKSVAKILYFSPKASFYTSYEEEAKVNYIVPQGVSFFSGTEENNVFIDFDKKKLTEQRDFMDRRFLIDQNLPEPGWKITGRQKSILDNNCIEAIRTDTSGSTVVVWFAPSIEVPSGPSLYVNLPGLVLEVDIDEGDTRYVAKSISFIKPDKNIFKKPKSGKKLTASEFAKVKAEKLKEMNDIAGTNGMNVTIIKKR